METDFSPLERLDALRNWEKGPRLRMEPTLDPMRDLMERLGSPHRAFNVIHVTGTKGKGSVCALLEVALDGIGFRVGRYASPHVDSICERVSLRRRHVDMPNLLGALERVLDVRDQASLAGTDASAATWFDVLTAAAFMLFAQERLDWVIAEVGLGGRLDSTNVLDGKVCVVTNVGLEHTDVLGPTIAHIAREKAGIVKPGARVVTGIAPGSEAHDILRARALEVGAMLVNAHSAVGIAQRNAAIARAVLDSMGALGISAPRGGDLLDGSSLDPLMIRAAALPGRMEHLLVGAQGRTIPILLDGAHVDIALAAVLDEAQGKPWTTGPMFALLAFGADKHPRRMLSLIRGRARHVVFTRLEGRDCWNPEELVTIATELGISSSAAGDPDSCLRACLQLASDAGWVLASGSLHIVAPVRRAVQAAQCSA